MELTAVVAVIAGISAYFNVENQKQQLLDEMITGVDQLSRSITSATWHTMLLDRREAAYEIMQTIGHKQGIDHIRIFNKEGRITFSTDPNAPEQVDKNAEACFLCHIREQPLVRVDVPTRARIFEGPDGKRKLAMVTPIYNEPACSDAPCHAHPEGRTVLGVLDVAMDLDHIDEEVASVQRRNLITFLAEVLLIGIVIAIFTRRFVDRPIKRLIDRTRAISAMELDHRVDPEVPGELGSLAEAFDIMRARLKVAMEENKDFTEQLERKVEERSRQLSETQQKLIQSDRLASLGKLSASVAHEINNPVSGVLNLAVLMQRLLDKPNMNEERLAQFREYLASMIQEVTRVGRIVSDLLAFSRRSAPQRAPVDLNNTVRHTIALIDHKLKLGSVTLNLDLSPAIPTVPADGAQLQQVIINLVMNAAQSMPGGGQVELRTRLLEREDSVLLEVQDFGIGISEENLTRVFDPFFSTKAAGKGVGLGLSVVHGIVESHGGVISVRSRLGEGSTFTVQLPLHPTKNGIRSELGGAGSGEPRG